MVSLINNNNDNDNEVKVLIRVHMIDSIDSLIDILDYYLFIYFLDIFLKRIPCHLSRDTVR